MNSLKIIVSVFAFSALTFQAAAEKISIPSKSSFRGKQVTLTGDFRPDSKGRKSPLVVLLHGCGGLAGAAGRSLNTHASALRRSGFSTLVLDSFGPRNAGNGWVCRSDSRLINAQRYRQKDVADAVAYLAKTDRINASKIFVMGQSNGGTVAVKLGQSRKIKGLRAIAAYYPFCGAVRKSSSKPSIIFVGDNDDWTPPQKCKAAHSPSRGVEVISYPNAVHSFDLPIKVQNYLGHKVGGNSAATSNSRSRMIRFFKKYAG
jgi:dienelactone hydrolase